MVFPPRLFSRPFARLFVCLVLCSHLSLPAIRAEEKALPVIRSRAAVLMDAETGTVLYEKNPGEEIPPASLAKLMTMHIVLSEIAAGRASLDETVPLPPEAWARNQPAGSSLMFLGPGQKVTLDEILLGLAVSSGNDAAVAGALRFAPTVSEFAGMMNIEARRMGLLRTRFTEPSGISEHNVTTAGEYARFCRSYILLHPESLSAYHSVSSFAYPREANVSGDGASLVPVVQKNRNTLLGAFPGVDGLKTGYIDESGYNIALTAERRGTRFVAVILGAPAGSGGERIRDEDGRRLLDWAFENYRTVRPSFVVERVRIWKGAADYAELVPGEPLPFTAPADRGHVLRYRAEVTDPLVAPLPAAYRAGTAIVSDEYGELRRIPLVTALSYERGGFFKRLGDSLVMPFRKK